MHTVITSSHEDRAPVPVPCRAEHGLREVHAGLREDLAALRLDVPAEALPAPRSRHQEIGGRTERERAHAVGRCERGVCAGQRVGERRVELSSGCSERVFSTVLTVCTPSTYVAAGLRCPYSDCGPASPPQSPQTTWLSNLKFGRFPSLRFVPLSSAWRSSFKNCLAMTDDRVRTKRDRFKLCVQTAFIALLSAPRALGPKRRTPDRPWLSDEQSA